MPGAGTGQGSDVEGEAEAPERNQSEEEHAIEGAESPHVGDTTARSSPVEDELGGCRVRRPAPLQRIARRGVRTLPGPSAEVMLLHTVPARASPPEPSSLSLLGVAPSIMARAPESKDGER